MSTPGMAPRGGGRKMPSLALNYPMSLGTFDKYEDAQRAVDYLSDHDFPVEKMLIVGTDLKQMERITGRLDWNKVLMGGLASGAWMGLFVGLILSMFEGNELLQVLGITVMLGAVFGAIWAAIGYSATRGKRDFTSVSQVVATKYEVLVEHTDAARGHELLEQMPGRSPF